MCNTGLILGLRLANERRHYKVTPSLNGWMLSVLVIYPILYWVTKCVSIVIQPWNMAHSASRPLLRQSYPNLVKSTATHWKIGYT